jgi:hypothetical protein
LQPELQSGDSVTQLVALGAQGSVLLYQSTKGDPGIDDGVIGVS